MRNIVDHLKHIIISRHDSTSLDGSRNRRIQLAFYASLTLVCSKLVSIVAATITVRWGATYLGAEQYGLWLTITSLLAILSLADLGIGNSIVNIAANSEGEDGRVNLRIGISNSIFSLVVLAAIIVISATIFCFTFNIAGMFNLKTAVAIREAAPSLLVFAVIAALTPAATIVQKVLIGQQLGWVASLCVMIGQIAATACLVAAIVFKATLPELIFAFSAPPVAVNAIVTLVYFFKNSGLTPSWSDISRRNVRALMASGGIFFFIQIMSILGSASDNIIIANLLGASQVPTFAVTQRLAMTINISQFFLAPLWPAYGEALSRNDHIWAKNIFYRSTRIALLSSVIPAIGLMIIGSQFVTFLTKGVLTPDSAVILGFSTHILIASLGGSLSTLLNNSVFLKRQMLVYFLASLASIVLKVVFVNYFKSPAGAIWATNIGYGIFFIIPSFAIIKSYFNEVSFANEVVATETGESFLDLRL